VAHQRHRELVPVVADEGESQACSLAKKAVAFFSGGKTSLIQGGEVVTP
jgi:hypothetical protein